VVEGATSIKVAIAGHSGSYPASVLGVDPTADVALIQVEGVSGLPVATLADSKTLSIGQEVAALGNALGLGGAPRATAGSVTALDQSITAGGSGTPEQLTGLDRERCADLAWRFRRSPGQRCRPGGRNDHRRPEQRQAQQYLRPRLCDPDRSAPPDREPDP